MSYPVNASIFCYKAGSILPQAGDQHPRVYLYLSLDDTSGIVCLIMDGVKITLKAGTGGEVKGDMVQAGVIHGGVNNEVSGQSQEDDDKQTMKNVEITAEGPSEDLKIGGNFHQAGAIKGGVNNKQVKSQGVETSERHSEDCYEMKSDPRGLCYIFNNKDFKDKSKTRIGAERDRDAMKNVFETLKFDVTCFDNSEADVMELRLKKMSELNHEKHNCLVLVFLTHGKDGQVQGSDDEWLKISEITSFFSTSNCPSMANKPKLFFFQSCRGKTEQKAVKMQFDGPGDDGGAEAKVGKEVVELVAPEADFFFGYSTVPGMKALRNPETGSWYIEALAKVLGDPANKREDLLGMMTKVKKLVNERKVECVDGTHLTQTAEMTVRLLKKLYFYQ